MVLTHALPYLSSSPSCRRSLWMTFLTPRINWITKLHCGTLLHFKAHLICCIKFQRVQFCNRSVKQTDYKLFWLCLLVYNVASDCPCTFFTPQLFLLSISLLFVNKYHYFIRGSFGVPRNPLHLNLFINCQ